MPQTNGNTGIKNVNLGLNYLTIDDVIYRAIALSEPRARKITEAQYRRRYRRQYGEAVFGSKVVIVRSDLNSNVRRIKNGSYEFGGIDRIRASAPTLKELSGYGAKVVVIAHQGTIGKNDCISLGPHRGVLEKILGREITFNPAHWYGPETVDIILKWMNRGDILLPDNVRHLAVETVNAQSPAGFIALPNTYMSVLEQVATFFINDAFSTSHRYHGSIVGFPNILNIAGRLTEQEIKKNRRLTADIRSPYTMLLGGVKVSGYIDFIQDSLRNDFVDYVLAAGVLGIMAIHNSRRQRKKIYLGDRTDKFLRDNGLYPLLPNVQAFANDERFVLPIDYKVELKGEVHTLTAEEIAQHPDRNEIGIYGLGPQTVELFSEKLRDSRTIYVKGSPTKDDDKRFLEESRQLISQVVEAKRQGTTTILSGGDTNTLVSRFGYKAKTDFTHFTLAGGAAAEYQAGNLLPGLLMLDLSHRAFWGIKEEPVLPPGYDPKSFLIRPKIPENLMPFRR